MGCSTSRLPDAPDDLRLARAERLRGSLECAERCRARRELRERAEAGDEEAIAALEAEGFGRTVTPEGMATIAAQGKRMAAQEARARCDDRLEDDEFSEREWLEWARRHRAELLTAERARCSRPRFVPRSMRARGRAPRRRSFSVTCRRSTSARGSPASKDDSGSGEPDPLRVGRLRAVVAGRAGEGALRCGLGWHVLGVLRHPRPPDWHEVEREARAAWEVAR